MITHDQVLTHFKSVRAVANFFGIKPSAVYQWKARKDRAIPRERELELKLKRPEVFGEFNG